MNGKGVLGGGNRRSKGSGSDRLKFRTLNEGWPRLEAGKLGRGQITGLARQLRSLFFSPEAKGSH